MTTEAQLPAGPGLPPSAPGREGGHHHRPLSPPAHGTCARRTRPCWTSWPTSRARSRGKALSAPSGKLILARERSAELSHPGQSSLPSPEAPGDHRSSAAQTLHAGQAREETQARQAGHSSLGLLTPSPLPCLKRRRLPRAQQSAVREPARTRGSEPPLPPADHPGLGPGSPPSRALPPILPGRTMTLTPAAVI